MRSRCRSFDWALTPLGPVESWSQSLCTVATAVLASRIPMLLFWGPRLIQFYNDAFRPSLGSSAEATARHPRALGMPAAEFWTDVWDVVGAQIDAVMTRGEAVWFENLHLPIERDGKLDDAWWTYSYSPVRDDDGRIGGTLVVCLETTAAVRAWEALEKERVRLSELFRQAPAFISVLRGPDHVYELSNEQHSQLIGRRDVIGRPVREAVPEAASQGYIELLDRVLQTGEPFTGRELPIVLHRTPGAPPEERYLTLVYQPITEADGQRSGVFVHGVDVTESVLARRAAEATAAALADSETRYRSLAEAVPVQVWTARPDGSLNFVSERTAAYFGVPAAQILDAGWHAFVHPEDLPAALTRWSQALASGTLYQTEFRLRSEATGEYRWHSEPSIA